MRAVTVATALSVSWTSLSLAQALPETSINVVGNLSTSTQSRLVEAPFWNDKIKSLSNGAIKVQFRPWNELGLKGPEVFKLLAAGSMNIATAQLGHHSGSDPI